MREVERVRVALVDRLPAAAGGGVAMQDADGMMWVLMEHLDAAGEDDGVDLGDWVDLAYDLLEEGRSVTCAGQARRFGVDLRVAQAAWWSFGIEWWHLRCLASS